MTEKTYHLMAVVKGSTPPVEKKEAPEPENEVFTWPHLVARLVLCFLVVFTVLFVISFLLDGPLETMANPSKTPNPAKASWYFLGLQELLVYFDPWIAGVMLPSIIISGLILIPYVDAYPEAQGGLHISERKFSIIFFLVGFAAWMGLIVFGEYFRGPGWQIYMPWESWDAHKTVALRELKNLPGIVGWLFMILYFGGGMVFPALLWPDFLRRRGNIKYALIMIHLLLFGLVFIKIFLRLFFDIKYIITLPWFNI